MAFINLPLIIICVTLYLSLLKMSEFPHCHKIFYKKYFSPSQNKVQSDGYSTIFLNTPNKNRNIFKYLKLCSVTWYEKPRLCETFLLCISFTYHSFCSLLKAQRRTWLLYRIHMKIEEVFNRLLTFSGEGIFKIRLKSIFKYNKKTGDFKL